MMRQSQMSAPDIQPDDIRLVRRGAQQQTAEHGTVSRSVREQAFADYIGTRHAVGVLERTADCICASAPAASAQGDEVITTPFSFVASANCILYERATPVFVDIDESTLNIDPALLAAAVTERTRAILPVHVFGRPCAMDELDDICRDRGLTMIEDACEALGATHGAGRSDRSARPRCPIYPNKQMTTGEGGIVTTDDADWAGMMRNLRNQGRGEMGEWLRHQTLGFNYRLNEMSAALGYSQVSRIEQMLRPEAKSHRSTTSCCAIFPA